MIEHIGLRSNMLQQMVHPVTILEFGYLAFRIIDIITNPLMGILAAPMEARTAVTMNDENNITVKYLRLNRILSLVFTAL